MYSELIHNFTENTEYSFNLDIDINTKNSVESFSDLENRVFSLKDCWEFNGFVDGSYLAVSENGKIPIIDKMGSEYEVLVNEFVDNQVLTRMGESISDTHSRIFYFYSQLEQINMKILSLGEDYNVNIVPTWNIIGEQKTVDEQNELLNIGRRFDQKYKSGFQTGITLGRNTPLKELEAYYENQDLTLPFSVEYVILASKENY